MSDKYKYLQNDELYKKMRDGGATPHRVYARAKQDGATEMAAMGIVHNVFRLSIIEAKEVRVQAEGLAPSLYEYQEQLFSGLEEDEREDE